MGPQELMRFLSSTPLENHSIETRSSRNSREGQDEVCIFGILLKVVISWSAKLANFSFISKITRNAKRGPQGCL